MNKAVKWGVITGFTCGGWMLAEYYLGWHESEIGQYSRLAAILFIISGLYLSIRQTREKEFGGFIDYKDAVRTGMISALIIAGLIAAFTFIYYKYINPGYIEYVSGVSEKYWRSKYYTEKDISSSLVKLRDAYSPGNQTKIALFMNIFFGMFITFVISLFLKRKPIAKNINE